MHSCLELVLKITDFCNTSYLESALKISFGFKLKFLVFCGVLKVDFLSYLNICFDFDTFA